MKHLTAAERGKIEILLQLKHSNAYIARKLGKHKSTIGREIAKNSNRFGDYISDYAQIKYKAHRLNSYNTPKLTKYPELCDYIRQKIVTGWDPSQISGRLKETGVLPRVATETIYKWVYESPDNIENSFYQYLRYGKKKRGKHRTHERTIQQFKLRNRVSIHDRPKIVEEKARIGDWEADTVLYPQKQLIVTAYERTSSFALFRQSPTKQTRIVCPILGSMLASTVTPKTLTLDNGVEFYRHEYITKLSGVSVYFADIYSSHQRGGNENLNRQLRAFLPRGHNITGLEAEELQAIQDELNAKPRKRLGWHTPTEVYSWLAKNPNTKLNLSKVAFDPGI